MSRAYFQRISAAWRQAKESWANKPIEASTPDWADDSQPVNQPFGVVRPPTLDDFDPDEFNAKLTAFSEADSKTPAWLEKQIADGRAVVDRGWLFEARVDGFGRMIKTPEQGRKVPYKLTSIKGHDNYMESMRRAEARGSKLQESFGNFSDQFDPNQYTEYAPLMGGYFFAQQYLTDMLKGFAYAFEAWNHNPLAHRIINALAQYSLGRRFTWHIKDEKKERVWEKFAEDINLVQRLSKFWVREKLIFGEQMLDVRKWRTIHPATVWDIITDPDDFSDVYYYYRSYPTAYQMFSGYKVPGVPGAQNVAAQKYVIEQLPFSQIIHTKANCTSFEKRGRSSLFTVLGWLKRIKDIYNNQAIREQMLSDYVWDVEIKGGPGDVAKYASQYSGLSKPGATHFHNDAVKRTPMAIPVGSGAGASEASNNILAFIATAIGLPKDFFNVIATSGGNRATALVAAEPFTKVIEDEQADIEFMLHKMAEYVFKQNGMEYSHEDIEFTFPSVTKDTTTETVKNIIIGEAQGYISKERAAGLYTQEMNITAYDFDEEQKTVKDEVNKGISNQGQPPVPEGRMGADGIIKDSPDVPAISVPDQPTSPIHGQGKVDLKGQMDNL